jgi:two-component system, NarL family, sensor histidine kinase DesK
MTNVTNGLASSHAKLRRSRVFAATQRKREDVTTPTTHVTDRRRLRAEPGAPNWGGLLWALPLFYVFVDPYRRQAAWLEWLITGAALLVFLALYTLGLIYWRRKEIVRLQCGAATVVAAVFTAYSPSGAIFFAMIAAFLPFSVSGRIAPAATLVGAVVLIFAAEWLALGREVGPFFYVIVVQSLLLGAGITFVARQQLENERLSRGSERERIARDLHDTLGQTLTIIALKSELAGRLLDQNADEARREIADVERVSREALAEVREVIGGYHGGGIHAELQRARSALQAAGISVEQDTDAVETSLAQERILGLVLRESVTNVVRHAQATRCELSFRQLGDSLRLLVKDNGRGGVHREGLGMRSIQARVEAIGGSAVWDGRSGTALTITLPVAVPGRARGQQS